MKIIANILYVVAFFIAIPHITRGQAAGQKISFDFYGDTIEFARTDAATVPYSDSLSGASIYLFYERMNVTDYQPAVSAILAYRQCHNPDDWVFYQLIRKTA